MKKVILVMVLAAVALCATAETLDEMDGFDWVVWSSERKLGYVIGWYNAYSSVWVWFLNTTEPSEEIDRTLEEMFYVPMTVGDMIERLDEYYRDYSLRRQRLMDVLMFIAGKDYWNSGTTPAAGDRS